MHNVQASKVLLAYTIYFIYVMGEMQTDTPFLQININVQVNNTSITRQGVF